MIFFLSLEWLCHAELDVCRCDVVDALVVALMIVGLGGGLGLSFEVIRQTTLRAQAHANNTQPRVRRRAWHKFSTKNK